MIVFTITIVASSNLGFRRKKAVGETLLKLKFLTRPIFTCEMLQFRGL